MEIILSKHAEARIKQRMGLNRKAAKRYAWKAFMDGCLAKDYYFKDIAMKYQIQQEKNFNNMYLFYKDMVHVFGLSAEKPILVTVYDPADSYDFVGRERI